MSNASVEFNPLFVKTLREEFCVAQQRSTSVVVKDLYSNLIAQLDEHRPLGSNGKHGYGALCTATCGCAERNSDDA
jgi:hypothetical protein